MEASGSSTYAPPYVRELPIWNSALSSQQPDQMFEENRKSPTQEGGAEKTPCSHGRLRCTPYGAEAHAELSSSF